MQRQGASLLKQQSAWPQVFESALYRSMQGPCWLHCEASFQAQAREKHRQQVQRQGARVLEQQLQERELERQRQQDLLLQVCIWACLKSICFYACTLQPFAATDAHEPA